MNYCAMFPILKLPQCLEPPLLGEGPPIKSQDHLYKWRHDFASKIKNIKFSLSQCSWSLNVSLWRYTLRSSHSSTPMTNYLHYISTCIGLIGSKLGNVATYCERIPPLKSHASLITWPTWGNVKNWQKKIFPFSQYLWPLNLTGWWF